MAHTGVAPPQSELAVHGPQLLFVVSHTGVAPAQSLLETQPTQVPVVASQAWVEPEHCDVFVPEHCPHAPLA